MSDHIVQLVAFSSKWVSMLQYGCLNLVNNSMVLLDSTWPKIMMQCDFVRQGNRVAPLQGADVMSIWIFSISDVLKISSSSWAAATEYIHVDANAVSALGQNRPHIFILATPSFLILLSLCILEIAKCVC